MSDARRAPGAPAGRIPPVAEVIAATAVATVAAIAVMRLGAVARWEWLLGPAVWFTAAVAANALREGGWPALGVVPINARRILRAFALALLIMAPAVLLWLAVCRGLGCAPALVPRVSGAQWPLWALHQLLYVAVSEELFFRGYVQGRLASARSFGGGWLGPAAGAAALFAGAHVAVLGSGAGAWVFFPALLFGWLRARTGSLWPAVLAHAAANILYAVLGALL